MAASSLDHPRGFFRASGDSDVFHVEKVDEGRGNAVKSDGALLPPLRTPSAEQKPKPTAVAVNDEEKTETMRRETWKIVSVSKTGKIRLRRFLHDQTKPSDAVQRSSTEHQPAEIAPPSTENKPAVIAQPEPPCRLSPNMRTLEDASLRSKLEMSKRKLREGYQQTENAKRQRRIQVIQPRAEIPKDSNKRPDLFKSLGTWLR